MWNFVPMPSANKGGKWKGVTNFTMMIELRFGDDVPSLLYAVETWTGGTTFIFALLLRETETSWTCERS